MNKEILKRILETVIAYYKANNDILPNDDTEDLKQQIEFLEDLINNKKVKMNNKNCETCKHCIDKSIWTCEYTGTCINHSLYESEKEKDNFNEIET